MSDRIFNFSPGPAILPEPVLARAQGDLLNIAGSGIGILEQSHRGPVVDGVFDETEADCRAVANIPDDYAVLFSIKEFKKQRLRYFLPELDEWRESRVGARQDENPNRTSATQA